MNQNNNTTGEISELRMRIEALINDKESQLEKAVIEGLKLKGFHFNTSQELESFVKIRCSVADSQENKTKTYFVDSIPFMIYNYKAEFGVDSSRGNVVVSAHYGSYQYI